MDLDQAIDIVLEHGRALAHTGAPHQKQLGEAMLLVADAVQARQTEWVVGTPRITVVDPFLERAQQAETDFLAGKPAAIGRQEDDLRRVMPIDTVIDESVPTGMAVLRPSVFVPGEKPSVAVVMTGLGTAGAALQLTGQDGTTTPAPDVKPRRLAQKS